MTGFGPKKNLPRRGLLNQFHCALVVNLQQKKVVYHTAWHANHSTSVYVRGSVKRIVTSIFLSFHYGIRNWILKFYYMSAENIRSLPLSPEVAKKM